MSSIQPSSYGAELISSGVSASAALTATTVPLTGAKRSETDLVDSTSPTAAPACDVGALVGQLDEHHVAQLRSARNR